MNVKYFFQKKKNNKFYKNKKIVKVAIQTKIAAMKNIYSKKTTNNNKKIFNKLI